MCVLRATGDDFHPETFLQASSFQPCNVFVKGERKSESLTWDTSGITVVVSDAWDDFSQQVKDAIEFLQSNRGELLRLRKSAGLEHMELDFGVSRKEGFLQGFYFHQSWFVLLAN